MANRLTMAKIQAIRGITRAEVANRRIARELDVDRETVAKYVRAASLRSKTGQSAHRLGRGRASRAAEGLGKARHWPRRPGRRGRSGRAQPSPLSEVATRQFKTGQSAHRVRVKTSQSAHRVGGGFWRCRSRPNRPPDRWPASRLRRRQFPRRRGAVAVPASPIGR